MRVSMPFCLATLFFSYVSNPFTFNKLVPAVGIERYTTTDNTQLIEKARRSKRNNRPMPHSDVQNHVQRNRAPRRCLKINFFRPVWEAHLKAEGRVVCRGRSLVVPLETAAPLCKPG